MKNLKSDVIRLKKEGIFIIEKVKQTLREYELDRIRKQRKEKK